MNDELQNTLAEIAKGVGTTTSELWTWLQGDGLEAYAAARIAQLWVGVSVAVVIGIICLIVVVAIFVMAKKKYDSDKMYGIDDLFFDVALLEIIPAGALIFDLISVSSIAGELAGWIASPQGMAISIFVDRL